MVNNSSILIKNGTNYITDIDRANILAMEYEYTSSNLNLPKNFQDVRSQTILKFLQTLPYLTINNNDSIHLNYIFSFREFEKALNSSNFKSAPGLDHISFNMVKHLPFEHKCFLLSLDVI